MSLTHYPSHLPDTLWWTHQHQYPIMDSATQTPIYSTADHHRQPPTINSDINNRQDSLNQPSKLPMFEKLLTPSDVGKLNRLVIPKQHAEKHFRVPSGDSVPAGDQRGLLLGFEDETGKPWRFRYCYWNSSQSYVLTKGWSRYVKEKRLNAGDVVLFERDRLDGDRLFIGWRRRSAAVAPPVSTGSVQVNRWAMKVSDAQYSYPSHHGQHIPLSIPNPCRHAGGANDNVGNNKSYSGNARRVRLFGVNLECPDKYEPSTQDGSSQGGQPQSQYSSGSNNLISHNMNINFSKLRYHQHQE